MKLNSIGAISLRTRLFAAFVLLLTIFSSLQIYSLMKIENANEEFKIVNRFHLKVALQAFALETSQSSLLLLLKNLVTGDSQKKPKRYGLLKRWIHLTQAKRNDSFRRLKKLISNKWNILRNKDKSFLKLKVIPLIKTVNDEIDSMKLRFGKILKSKKSISKAEARSITRHEHLIMTRIRRIALIIKNRVRQFAQRLEDNEQSLLKQQIILLVAAFILALIIIVLAARPLRYLVGLTEGARKFGRGNLSVRIPVTSKDELGILAAEFNAMAKAIEDREVKLIQNERLAAAGKLAAQIAHEIRNPLAAISFNVELLQDITTDFSDNNSEKEEFVDILHGLHSEVDRLTGITEEYLTFSRLPKPKPESTDLNLFISDFLDFIEGELLIAQHIKVQSNLTDKLPLVNIDPGLIKQVLLNLFRNSCEAMKDKGSITISTSYEAPNVLLSVQDSGNGMTKDNLQNIFEAFYTTKEHGTGLGMALSKQIIEEHNGKIRVESEPGKGTLVILSFQELK